MPRRIPLTLVRVGAIRIAADASIGAYMGSIERGPSFHLRGARQRTP